MGALLPEGNIANRAPVSLPAPQRPQKIADQKPIAAAVATERPLQAVSGLAETAQAALAERSPALKSAMELAQPDLEAMRKSADARGYEEGLKRGLAAGRQQLVEQASKLKTVHASLEQARSIALQDAEDQIVEAVFEATLRLLGQAMTTKQGCAAVVKQVIAQTQAARGALTVALSPSDYALLQDLQTELAAAAPEATFKMCADPRVELGGCLLDTPGGSVDGRLEVQLERLRAALVEARAMIG